MKTVTRKVFYCDYCKRHRLTPSAIEAHEPKCIYNPYRSRCGWHADVSTPFPGEYRGNPDDEFALDILREWAIGCPACMLAVIVQKNWVSVGFDYKAEIKRFRDDERNDEAIW